MYLRLTGFLVFFFAATAQGQEADSKAAPTTPPSAGPSAPSTKEKEVVNRLAQILNPKEYGPAVLVGAQAEIVGPLAGVTGLVVGYDAVRLQAELSLGAGVGRATLQGAPSDDVYSLSLRIAVPVHRGIRADFAVFAAGGVEFIDPPDASVDALAGLSFGGRFRAFLTPNLATIGTLGVGAFFRGGEERVVFGAIPLGAAAVAYYFR